MDRGWTKEKQWLNEARRGGRSTRGLVGRSRPAAGLGERYNLKERLCRRFAAGAATANLRLNVLLYLPLAERLRSLSRNEQAIVTLNRSAEGEHDERRRSSSRGASD
jgi:hypothetical protein